MTTKTSQATDEARIRALIDGRAKRLRAKDVDGFLSHYAADIVKFDLAPPLQYAGAAALDKNGLATWFGSFKGPIGYELRDLSVTTAGDLAWCHGFARLTGARTDGDQTDVWFRHTLCFCKIGGAWKIAHEHESVPFYMDGSYKAAVDLKP